MADRSRIALSSLAVVPLVGRDSEKANLRDTLAAAFVGRGSLILIGGEAGIGKTTLAEWLCDEAAAQGATVLLGRCYDLSETPPYGPWAEALAHAPRAGSAQVPPDLAGGDGTASQAALFAAVREYLAALAAQQPLALLLDDLHWADPASLSLLRFLGRQVADLPIVLLATYHADELTRQHPLYQLLPLLVREARSHHLDLRCLEPGELLALVRALYGLVPADEERLVAYLVARSEGNPFFAGELLRALEEGRTLRRHGHAWILDSLASLGVPPLLRQVLDARLDRLGEPARELLAVAAIIGQEVPFDLWQAVSGADETALLAAVDAATAAHLLAERPDGDGVRFAHALVREALYEGLTRLRRRHLHRHAAEALLATAHPDPDVVGYHLRQAGDPRAADWLARAGARALGAYALVTAAERFRAALALLPDDDAHAGERGWLLYWIGWSLRWTQQAQAARTFGEARELGARANDRALAALALSEEGRFHCNSGERTRGVAELLAGVTALDALTPEEQTHLERRLANSRGHNSPARHGLLITHLAHSGRTTEAITLGTEYLARPTPTIPDRTWMVDRNGAYHGLAIAHALLGQFPQARRRFAEAQRGYREVGENTLAGWIALCEVWLLLLVATPEDRASRERAARESEETFALALASEAQPHDPRLVLMPQGLADGRWMEAQAIAEKTIAIQPRGSITDIARAHLGWIAWARGDLDLAWEQIRATFPSGPEFAPADTFFPAAPLLLLLGFALALHAGPLSLARSWLDARDQWLTWGGAVVGRAQGTLGRALYHRASGDALAAQHHATQALHQAGEPRQPLTLLAAHRLLGELETAAGRHGTARSQLVAALALAEACAAPYERALTLLTLAELDQATGDHARAAEGLGAARAILGPLGARPALARADALAARLTDRPPAVIPQRAPRPFGLTAREAEVLRLVAQGHPNAEIAARCSLSHRTVEQHLRSVYGKLGVANRATATRIAVEHGLAGDAP